MKPTLPRVDWNQIPAKCAHAHRLRSAEMRRMLGLLGSSIGGLARRLTAPGGRRPALTAGRRLHLLDRRLPVAV